MTEEPKVHVDSTEETIGKLLQLGVLTAASIVLIGGLVYLSRYGRSHPDYRAFRAAPPDLRTVGGVVLAAFSGRSKAIIQLGLLVLIATPIARVAFSVYAFARQRDRLYVYFTLIVLALLIYSLVWGKL